MTAGARGYVLKAGAPDELFQAARTAACGGAALGPDAAARVVSRLTGPEPVLTDREIEVIRLVAQGLGNRAGAVSEAVRRGLVELR
ncbi:hypothetical protein [Saccharothrix deserti]|uniref:hypothetical protein n=1 Tax=Saccharothrix deserti TaxID=2593674 RepID=UPI00131CFCC3|nr:hypothetical protein [Saccharothrix deserti]